MDYKGPHEINIGLIKGDGNFSTTVNHYNQQIHVNRTIQNTEIDYLVVTNHLLQKNFIQACTHLNYGLNPNPTWIDHYFYVICKLDGKLPKQLEYPVIQNLNQALKTACKEINCPAYPFYLRAWIRENYYGENPSPIQEVKNLLDTALQKDCQRSDLNFLLKTVFGISGLTERAIFHRLTQVN